MSLEVHICLSGQIPDIRCWVLYSSIKDEKLELHSITFLVFTKLSLYNWLYSE